MVRIPLLVTAVWIACITAPAYAGDDNRVRIGADPNLSDGATALSIGNYGEGIRLTELGLDAPPMRNNRSAAMSNLCAGFNGTQEYRRAIEHCSAALELDDSNWQAHNNRALAYFRLGNLEAAQKDIDRGLELNPESGKLKRVQKLIQRRRSKNKRLLGLDFMVRPATSSVVQLASARDPASSGAARTDPGCRDRARR